MNPSIGVARYTLGIAILALVGTSHVRAWATNPNEVATPNHPPNTATSQQFEFCPDGHKALRDVPILYGLNYLSPMYKQDVQELKFIPGGCGYDVNSPTSAVVCTVCRFKYYGAGKWEKSNTNKGAFGHAFSKIVTDFEQHFQGTSRVDYSQQMKEGVVLREGIQFRYVGDVAQASAAVTNLMNASDITPLQPRYKHELFLGTNTQKKAFQVWLLSDQGQTLLDLSVFPASWLTDEKRPNKS